MRFQVCAVMLLVSVLLPFAGAQPGPPFVPCLDTLAINAKYVMVGKIIETHPLVTTAANTNVVISVEKWLKGDGQSDKTQARIDAPLAVLTEWKTRGNRLLIFNGVQGDMERAIDLSDPDVKVLTAEMRVLSDPWLVLQAAQEAISRHPGVFGIYTFRRRVPSETTSLLGQGGGLTTTVPADVDLERWALAALDSKQVWDRAEGADALWYFPSDSNAARLKRLLDDPALVNSGPDDQIYIVRENAYRSLQRMGVRVPEPATRKQTRRR